MNIDDGDMWIAEFAGGGLASIQSSYVTVGNYPGIEARIYGSEGALIVRLVEEEGICQTLKAATKDSVEFMELEIPAALLPRGRVLAGALALPVLLQPDQQLRHRDPRRRPREPGRLPSGRPGAGDDQRVRSLAPSPRLGRLPADAVMSPAAASPSTAHGWGD